MTGLRLIFFGTPGFAVPSLERLLSSRHAVVGVVTQPDRARGRGHHVSPSPIKALATTAGLPVLQPTHLRDDLFLRKMDALSADLGVVVAYGRLLPNEVLSRPRLGLINVHASLLPRFRGAAPVHRAVMAGDTTTGVTIMRIVEALDAGPMLARVAFAIGPDDTSAAVEQALGRIGADLLADVIDRLASGPVPEQPQNEILATHAPRITREDGLIDWHQPAVHIHNQIRGLHPWPHAYSHLAGRRYLLLRSAHPGTEPAVAACEPARVLEASGDVLRVCTGDGRALRILELQLDGRRPMTVREFLAGHRIDPGARFGASTSEAGARR